MYKYRLEYRGNVVAESDWSGLLFAQKNKRPEKAANYDVYRNADGKLAGSTD